jgi:uncharacterized protein YcaQ
MTFTNISWELVRRLVLNSQLLDGQAQLPEDKEGVAQTIEKLGYVQIDTIAVIQRAHHHTLWTRHATYDPEMLHELQANDRRVFEYWGHAMSYVPMKDYRYYLPRMRNLLNTRNNWAKDRLRKAQHAIEPVLERIRREGPLSSKDFEPPPGKKGGAWWDWKPAKIALELLFWQGKLMISERRKFQKVYDLTERVLPEDVDTRYPDDDELGRFFVRRGLSAYGVAQEKEIQVFLQPGAARDSIFQAAGREVIAKSLRELVDAGEVSPLKIKEDENSEYYALTETLEKTAHNQTAPAQVFLLSPFDNLIIQRDRTRRLFGFDYSLECYTPAPKRKYGYFVLPILWGDKLIGRLDPKADRKGKTLFIRSLMLEAGFNAFDEFLPSFVAKLSGFARFNQCDKVIFENVSPAGIKTAVKRSIKEAL